MKKTLTILTILVIALVAMMGSVNAAETAKLTASREGDTVTVTLSLQEATGKVQFNLAYDSSLLTYVSASAGSLSAQINAREAGLVKLAALGMGGETTKTVTLTFKLNAGVEEGTANFELSNLKGTTEGLANSTASVKIEKTVVPAPSENPSPAPSTEPTTPAPSTAPSTNPTTPETPSTSDGNNSSTSQNGDILVGTNGEVITKLPQTGAPIYVGVAVLIALAVVAVVARKIRK